MWTHKAADLALHPVVGLVLQVGDGKFPQALGFESLEPFFLLLELASIFVCPLANLINIFIAARQVILFLYTSLGEFDCHFTAPI